MATINNIYVFVDKESMGRPVTVPQHKVETGLPLTDLVKKGAKTLSINGEIVDTKSLKADEIINKLENLEYTGSLIKYIGKENVGNFMIADFNVDHDKNIHGGAAFDMQLVEARIAKSAYDPSKQKAAEEEKNKTNPTLEVGSIVVFTGGYVYVSSDAAKPAATRGRSTCKITIINERSWSIHDYHLISTDGGMVYGWVDKGNIEGSGTTITSVVTDAGTTQVTEKPDKPLVTFPLQRVGYLKTQFTIAKSVVKANTATFEGASGNKYYCHSDGYYYLVDNATESLMGAQYLTFPSGIPYYRRR